MHVGGEEERLLRVHTATDRPVQDAGVRQLRRDQERRVRARQGVLPKHGGERAADTLQPVVGASDPEEGNALAE